MRTASYLIITSVLLVCALAGQHSTTTDRNKGQSFPDKIDHVRGSVVQIAISVGKRADIQDPILRGNFDEFGRVVAGTGVVINSAGDIVTAYHVEQGLEQITTLLQKAGVTSESVVGFAIPNGSKVVLKDGVLAHRDTSTPLPAAPNGEKYADIPDGAKLSIQNRSHVLNGKAYLSFYVTPFSVKASDPVHDIAVLSLTGHNPIQDQTHIDPANWASVTKTSIATFNAGRPRDGDDIFACGFPLNESSLITTTGRIAGAWDIQNLVTARANGSTEQSETYKADLRINPGNSGGPVFLLKDLSVIGIVVETVNKNGSEGMATIVPSKYVIDLLKRNNIPLTVQR